METKANYSLIGLFTLAVIAGVFGFIYWFQNTGGTGERAYYQIVFDGSVSGLRTGASVLFNGIRVGEVTGLKLNPDKPQQVIAAVSVDKAVAIRSDTQIGLEFQGLDRHRLDRAQGRQRRQAGAGRQQGQSADC